MLLSKIVDINKYNLQDCEFDDILKVAEKTKKGDIFFCLTDDIQIAKKRCEVAKEKGAKVIFSKFDCEGCVCCE